MILNVLVDVAIIAELFLTEINYSDCIAESVAIIGHHTRSNMVDDAHELQTYAVHQEIKNGGTH